MPKRQTNNLRWTAELQMILEFPNRDDRPTVYRHKQRVLRYEDIGITANEKYLSQQAKTEVVRRIKIRLDKSINEKFNGVRIGNTDYNITRIFTNMDKREMELSLAYVD